MTSPDQAQLDQAITRTRSGDIDAFDEVVRLCHWPLRCWLAGRCPPEIDPDEVAHLAFVTAYHALPDYQDHTGFRSWLWTIARNQLLAQLSANRRLVAKRAGYLPDAIRRHLERQFDDRDDGDDRDLTALRKCLERLTPLARSFVERHYRDGFPLTSIANELKKSHGAVKKQIFVIRRALRACIEQARSSP